jgi:hypothetical protein
MARVRLGLADMRAAKWLGVIAAAALLLSVLMPTAAFAEWDYWITNGASKVAKCPGPNGSYVKLANADGKWVYIDGIATCKDAGANYVFDIKFLKVSINGTRSADIVRDPISFDWLGLAIYRPKPGQQRIEWLYDEAKPIQGSLRNRPDQKVYFGNLQFVVPKAATDQATRFSFYLMAKGIPFVFGAL